MSERVIWYKLLDREGSINLNIIATVDEFKKRLKQQNTARLAAYDADELDVSVGGTVLSSRGRICEYLEAFAASNGVNVVDVVVDIVLPNSSSQSSQSSQSSKSNQVIPSNAVLPSAVSNDVSVEEEIGLMERMVSTEGIEDVDDMTLGIVTASMSTAHCFTSDTTFMERFNVLNACQQPSQLPKLAAALAKKPLLGCCRAVNGELVGMTPLHIAAMFHNVGAVSELLKQACVSAWDRDLVGRTPLHVAMMRPTKAKSAQQLEVCELLKAAMIKERGVEPTGQNAPRDMANNTPLGTGLAANTDAVTGNVPLRTLLFQPGDHTVLPRTPTSVRVGGSPLKSLRTPRSLHGNTDQMFDSPAKSEVGAPGSVKTEGKTQSSLFSSPMFARNVSHSTPLLPSGAASHRKQQGRPSAGMPPPPSPLSNSKPTPWLGSQIESSLLRSTCRSSTVGTTDAVRSLWDARIAGTITKYSNVDTEQLGTERLVPTVLSFKESLLENSTSAITAMPDVEPAMINFGFSLANGWRGKMEDRICIQCPLTIPVSTFGETPETETIDIGLFAVIDGHESSCSASYLAEHLPRCILVTASAIIADIDFPVARSRGQLESDPRFWSKLLTDVCVTVEDELAALPNMQIKINPPGPKQSNHNPTWAAGSGDGAAAVICVVTSALVIAAGVGDCRALLASRNVEDMSSATGASLPVAQEIPSVPGFCARRMSVDHKFDPVLNPSECARATGAGAILSQVSETMSFQQVSYNPPDTYEITPHMLRMSRSFGDFTLKRFADNRPGAEPNTFLPHGLQPVIAEPDIFIHNRSTGDAFLFLACDGIWDVMSDIEVAEKVLTGCKTSSVSSSEPLQIGNTGTLAEVCDNILEESVLRGSMDNLSCILVALTDCTRWSPPLNVATSAAVNDQISTNEPSKADADIDSIDLTAMRLF